MDTSYKYIIYMNLGSLHCTLPHSRLVPVPTLVRQLSPGATAFHGTFLIFLVTFVEVTAGSQRRSEYSSED